MFHKMCPGIKTHIGIKRFGLSLSSNWTPRKTAKFLEGWKITGAGNLVGLVNGGILTVGGTAGSYTFQVPQTTPYLNADADNIWVKTDNTTWRTATEAEMVSYDFTKTFVKYDNINPYSIREIWILVSGQALTADELNKMRDYAQLSIWWDNTLSFHGDTKGNRSQAQSVWTPELTGFKMAQNFTARMSINPITAVNTLLVNLCNSLLSAGLWVKGDYLLLGRLHTSQASLLNVFKDGFNGSLLGNMIYSEKLGWYGDGVNGSVLLMNYKVGDGLASLNDNASVIDILETIAEAKTDFGSTDGANYDIINAKDYDNGNKTLLCNFESGNSVHLTAARGSIIGLHTNSRTGSTDFIYYFNNALFTVDASTRASVALTGLKDVGGGINLSGTYINCSTKRFDVLGRFKGLTAQNVSDLYDIITAFNSGMLATNLYDSYTKSLLHLNGKNASVVFTDEAGKIWTGYSSGPAQIITSDKKFGTGCLQVLGAAYHDYIDTPAHSDFNVGNGDFTIDLWLKRASVGAVMGIIGQGQCEVMTNIAWFFWLGADDKINVYISHGSTYLGFTTVQTISDITTWHHIALVRYGNTLKLYIDGIADVNSVDMTGITINNSTANLSLGRYMDYDGYYFNGAIDEFRFSKGIARWITNFTPPTQEYQVAHG